MTMTPDDINRARDAIAARAVYGHDTDRHNDPTEGSIDANKDYLRFSLDPKFGWGAALNEMVKLRIENQRLQGEVDVARKRVEDLTTGRLEPGIGYVNVIDRDMAQ